MPCACCRADHRAVPASVSPPGGACGSVRLIDRVTRHCDRTDRCLPTVRDRIVDAFIPYLRKRWSEGCVNAAALYAEITAQGYRGSVKIIRRHLQHWRITGPPAESPPVITPRKATGWIMRRPEEVTEDERDRLQQIPDRSNEINTTHRLAAAFALLNRPTIATPASRNRPRNLGAASRSLRRPGHPVGLST